MTAIVPQENTDEGNIFCIKDRFYWNVTPPEQDK
jgi:hypothetical protein